MTGDWLRGSGSVSASVGGSLGIRADARDPAFIRAPKVEEPLANSARFDRLQKRTPPARVCWGPFSATVALPLSGTASVERAASQVDCAWTVG